LTLVIIIMVIVAALALAAIAAWFFLIKPPIQELNIYDSNGQNFDQISLTTYQPQAGDPPVPSIEFRILDQDKEGVDGVTVTLKGQGVSQVGETDSNGRVTIPLTGVILVEGELSGEISVVAKKGGYQKDTTELIIVA